MAKLLVHLGTAVEDVHDVQVFIAGNGLQYARPATASTV